MPMRSSYEAVAASYHVEDSEDELDLEYDDGLMSRRSPWSHPLIGESHQSFAMNAINSSDDEGNEILETFTLVSRINVYVHLFFYLYFLEDFQTLLNKK